MAQLQGIIEERGADWDVRHDYEILGEDKSFAGGIFKARDVRISYLPCVLKSIPLAGQNAHEIFACYTLAREVSLTSPFLGDIHRIVLHRRNEGPQLVIAMEPPQSGTLAYLLKQWLDNPKEAPPAFDDAHILHTAIGLLEALIDLEAAGFVYRDINPWSVGVGNTMPATFIVPQIVDFDVPGTNPNRRPRPEYQPPFARGENKSEWSTAEHARVDMYGIGVLLYQLRTWGLWPGAESSDGFTDEAVMELNKFRVGDPLREVLFGLTGGPGAPASFETLSDAHSAVRDAFWKVAAVKSGVALPNSPLQAKQPEAVEIGQESLVILEDRELWNHAKPEIQDAVIKEIAKGLSTEFEHLRTEAFICGSNTHRIAVFKHLATGMEMSLVPGGLYNRGTLDVNGEFAWCRGKSFDVTRELLQQEGPATNVIIQPLLVGRYPVLVHEWETILKGKSKDNSQMPATGVAMPELVKAFDKLEGTLRLPSESEWEYLARGGARTRYYWGEEPDDNYYWNAGNSGGAVHKPSEHDGAANSFGLVDMLGNVLEWCEDHFNESYAEVGRDHRPWLDKRNEAADRVVRGGCSWYGPAFCRAAARASVRAPLKVKRGETAPTFEILGWRAVRSIQ